MRSLVSAGHLEERPTRVAVVGGGAAGVITARRLLEQVERPQRLDVLVVGEAARLGPGLAYRTTQPLHTLNNFAGRLSAVDGDPDHLLRWCAVRGIPAEPTSFLPRAVYGDYLAHVLDEAEVPAGSLLRRARGTVLDVREEAGGELTVELAEGWSSPADVVVLALGNPPPRALGAPWRGHTPVVDDPWAGDLTALAAGAREVLLVGTGLTMADVVAQLHAACPGTRFTAVSRSGRLPAAHRPGSPRLHDVPHPGTSTLDELVDRVGERIRALAEAGGDWRDVVDSLRVHANDLWAGLSPADQDRFVAETARTWETLRHRMSPAMAAHLAELRSDGVLRLARVDEVRPRDFDLVVNCTGPAPVPTPGWSPLVDALLERGTIRPHRLGLGLDLDAEGRVVGADGLVRPRLYAVGAARRGIEWEVAAIPDLRAQAARLARRLVTSPAAGDTARRTRHAGSARSVTA